MACLDKDTLFSLVFDLTDIVEDAKSKVAAAIKQAVKSDKEDVLNKAIEEVISTSPVQYRPGKINESDGASPVLIKLADMNAAGSGHFSFTLDDFFEAVKKASSKEHVRAINYAIEKFGGKGGLVSFVNGLADIGNGYYIKIVDGREYTSPLFPPNFFYNIEKEGRMRNLLAIGTYKNGDFEPIASLGFTRRSVKFGKPDDPGLFYIRFDPRRFAQPDIGTYVDKENYKKGKRRHDITISKLRENLGDGVSMSDVMIYHKDSFAGDDLKRLYPFLKDGTPFVVIGYEGGGRDASTNRDLFITLMNRPDNYKELMREHKLSGITDILPYVSLLRVSAYVDLYDENGALSDDFLEAYRIAFSNLIGYYSDKKGRPTPLEISFVDKSKKIIEDKAIFKDPHRYKIVDATALQYINRSNIFRKERIQDNALYVLTHYIRQGLEKLHKAKNEDLSPELLRLKRELDTKGWLGYVNKLLSTYDILRINGNRDIRINHYPIVYMAALMSRNYNEFFGGIDSIPEEKERISVRRSVQEVTPEPNKQTIEVPAEDKRKFLLNIIYDNPGDLKSGMRLIPAATFMEDFVTTRESGIGITMISTSNPIHAKAEKKVESDKAAGVEVVTAADLDKEVDDSDTVTPVQEIDDFLDPFAGDSEVSMDEEETPPAQKPNSGWFNNTISSDDDMSLRRVDLNDGISYEHDVEYVSGIINDLFDGKVEVSFADSLFYRGSALHGLATKASIVLRKEHDRASRKVAVHEAIHQLKYFLSPDRYEALLAETADDALRLKGDDISKATKKEKEEYLARWVEEYVDKFLDDIILGNYYKIRRRLPSAIKRVLDILVNLYFRALKALGVLDSNAPINTLFTLFSGELQDTEVKPVSESFDTRMDDSPVYKVMNAMYDATRSVLRGAYAATNDMAKRLSKEAKSLYNDKQANTLLFELLYASKTEAVQNVLNKLINAHGKFNYPPSDINNTIALLNYYKQADLPPEEKQAGIRIFTKKLHNIINLLNVTDYGIFDYAAIPGDISESKSSLKGFIEFAKKQELFGVDRFGEYDISDAKTAARFLGEYRPGALSAYLFAMAYVDLYNQKLKESNIDLPEITVNDLYLYNRETGSSHNVIITGSFLFASLLSDQDNAKKLMRSPFASEVLHRFIKLSVPLMDESSLRILYTQIMNKDGDVEFVDGKVVTKLDKAKEEGIKEVEEANIEEIYDNIEDFIEDILLYYRENIENTVIASDEVTWRDQEEQMTFNFSGAIRFLVSSTPILNYNTLGVSKSAKVLDSKAQSKVVNIKRLMSSIKEGGSKEKAQAFLKKVREDMESGRGAPILRKMKDNNGDDLYIFENYDLRGTNKALREAFYDFSTITYSTYSNSDIVTLGKLLQLSIGYVNDYIELAKIAGEEITKDTYIEAFNYAFSQSGKAGLEFHRFFSSFFVHYVLPALDDNKKLRSLMVTYNSDYIAKTLSSVLPALRSLKESVSEDPDLNTPEINELIDKVIGRKGKMSYVYALYNTKRAEYERNVKEGLTQLLSYYPFEHLEVDLTDSDIIKQEDEKSGIKIEKVGAAELLANKLINLFFRKASTGDDFFFGEMVYGHGKSAKQYQLLEAFNNEYIPSVAHIASTVSSHYGYLTASGVKKGPMISDNLSLDKFFDPVSKVNLLSALHGEELSPAAGLGVGFITSKKVKAQLLSVLRSKEIKELPTSKDAVDTVIKEYTTQFGTKYKVRGVGEVQVAYLGEIHSFKESHRSVFSVNYGDNTFVIRTMDVSDLPERIAKVLGLGYSEGKHGKLGMTESDEAVRVMSSLANTFFSPTDYGFVDVKSFLNAFVSNVFNALYYYFEGDEEPDNKYEKRIRDSVLSSVYKLGEFTVESSAYTMQTLAAANNVIRLESGDTINPYSLYNVAHGVSRTYGMGVAPLRFERVKGLELPAPKYVAEAGYGSVSEAVGAGHLRGKAAIVASVKSILDNTWHSVDDMKDHDFAVMSYFGIFSIPAVGKKTFLSLLNSMAYDKEQSWQFREKYFPAVVAEIYAAIKGIEEIEVPDTAGLASMVNEIESYYKSLVGKDERSAMLELRSKDLIPGVTFSMSVENGKVKSLSLPDALMKMIEPLMKGRRDVFVTNILDTVIKDVEGLFEMMVGEAPLSSGALVDIASELAMGQTNKKLDVITTLAVEYTYYNAVKGYLSSGDLSYLAPWASKRGMERLNAMILEGKQKGESESEIRAKVALFVLGSAADSEGAHFSVKLPFLSPTVYIKNDGAANAVEQFLEDLVEGKKDILNELARNTSDGSAMLIEELTVDDLLSKLLGEAYEPANNNDTQLKVSETKAYKQSVFREAISDALHHSETANQAYTFVLLLELIDSYRDHIKEEYRHYMATAANQTLKSLLYQLRSRERNKIVDDEDEGLKRDERVASVLYKLIYTGYNSTHYRSPVSVWKDTVVKEAERSGYIDYIRSITGNASSIEEFVSILKDRVGKELIDYMDGSSFMLPAEVSEGVFENSEYRVILIKGFYNFLDLLSDPDTRNEVLTKDGQDAFRKGRIEEILLGFFDKGSAYGANVKFSPAFYRKFDAIIDRYLFRHASMIDATSSEVVLEGAPYLPSDNRAKRGGVESGFSTDYGFNNLQAWHMGIAFFSAAVSYLGNPLQFGSIENMVKRYIYVQTSHSRVFPAPIPYLYSGNLLRSDIPQKGRAVVFKGHTFNEFPFYASFDYGSTSKSMPADQAFGRGYNFHNHLSSLGIVKPATNEVNDGGGYALPYVVGNILGLESKLAPIYKDTVTQPYNKFGGFSAFIKHALVGITPYIALNFSDRAWNVLHTLSRSENEDLYNELSGIFKQKLDEYLSKHNKDNTKAAVDFLAWLSSNDGAEAIEKVYVRHIKDLKYTMAIPPSGTKIAKNYYELDLSQIADEDAKVIDTASIEFDIENFGQVTNLHQDIGSKTDIILPRQHKQVLQATAANISLYEDIEEIYAEILDNKRVVIGSILLSVLKDGAKEGTVRKKIYDMIKGASSNGQWDEKKYIEAIMLLHAVAINDSDMAYKIDKSINSEDVAAESDSLREDLIRIVGMIAERYGLSRELAGMDNESQINTAHAYAMSSAFARVYGNELFRGRGIRMILSGATELSEVVEVFKKNEETGEYESFVYTKHDAMKLGYVEGSIELDEVSGLPKLKVKPKPSSGDVRVIIRPLQGHRLLKVGKGGMLETLADDELKRLREEYEEVNTSVLTAEDAVEALKAKQWDKYRVIKGEIVLGNIFLTDFLMRSGMTIADYDKDYIMFTQLLDEAGLTSRYMADPHQSPESFVNRRSVFMAEIKHIVDEEGNPVKLGDLLVSEKRGEETVFYPKVDVSKLSKYKVKFNTEVKSRRKKEKKKVKPTKANKKISNANSAGLTDVSVSNDMQLDEYMQTITSAVQKSFDKALNSLLATRIPVSNMNAIRSYRVVGFVDAANIVFIPSEYMFIAGEDADGDALTTQILDTVAGIQKSTLRNKELMRKEELLYNRLNFLSTIFELDIDDTIKSFADMYDRVYGESKVDKAQTMFMMSQAAARSNTNTVSRKLIGLNVKMVEALMLLRSAAVKSGMTDALEMAIASSLFRNPEEGESIPFVNKIRGVRTDSKGNRLTFETGMVLNPQVEAPIYVEGKEEKYKRQALLVQLFERYLNIALDANKYDLSKMNLSVDTGQYIVSLLAIGMPEPFVQGFILSPLMVALVRAANASGKDLASVLRYNVGSSMMEGVMRSATDVMLSSPKGRDMMYKAILSDGSVDLDVVTQYVKEVAEATGVFSIEYDEKTYNVSISDDIKVVIANAIARRGAKRVTPAILRDAITDAMRPYYKSMLEVLNVADRVRRSIQNVISVLETFQDQASDHYKFSMQFLKVTRSLISNPSASYNTSLYEALVNEKGVPTLLRSMLKGSSFFRKGISTFVERNAFVSSFFDFMSADVIRAMATMFNIRGTRNSKKVRLVMEAIQRMVSVEYITKVFSDEGNIKEVINVLKEDKTPATRNISQQLLKDIESVMNDQTMSPLDKSIAVAYALSARFAFALRAVLPSYSDFNIILDDRGEIVTVRIGSEFGMDASTKARNYTMISGVVKNSPVLALMAYAHVMMTNPTDSGFGRAILEVMSNPPAPYNKIRYTRFINESSIMRKVRDFADKVNNLPKYSAMDLIHSIGKDLTYLLAINEMVYASNKNLSLLDSLDITVNRMRGGGFRYRTNRRKVSFSGNLYVKRFIIKSPPHDVTGEVVSYDDEERRLTDIVIAQVGMPYSFSLSQNKTLVGLRDFMYMKSKMSSYPIIYYKPKLSTLNPFLYTILRGVRIEDTEEDTNTVTKLADLDYFTAFAYVDKYLTTEIGRSLKNLLFRDKKANTAFNKFVHRLFRDIIKSNVKLPETDDDTVILNALRDYVKDKIEGDTGSLKKYMGQGLRQEAAEAIAQLLLKIMKVSEDPVFSELIREIETKAGTAGFGVLQRNIMTLLFFRGILRAGMEERIREEREAKADEEGVPADQNQGDGNEQEEDAVPSDTIGLGIKEAFAAIASGSSSVDLFEGYERDNEAITDERLLYLDTAYRIMAESLRDIITSVSKAREEVEKTSMMTRTDYAVLSRIANLPKLKKLPKEKRVEIVGEEELAQYIDNNIDTDNDAYVQDIIGASTASQEADSTDKYSIKIVPKMTKFGIWDVSMSNTVDGKKAKINFVNINAVLASDDNELQNSVLLKTPHVGLEDITTLLGYMEGKEIKYKPLLYKAYEKVIIKKERRGQEKKQVDTGLLEMADESGVLINASIEHISKSLGIDVETYHDPESPVKGYVRDGKIFINTARATIDTPWHEVSHLFYAVVKEENTPLFNRIRSAILNGNVPVSVLRSLGVNSIDELMAKLREEYAEGDVEEEVIVTVMGVMAGKRQLASRTLLGRMVQAAKEFFYKVLGAIGLGTYPSVLLENVVSDMMSGRYRTSREMSRFLGLKYSKELDKTKPFYSFIKNNGLTLDERIEAAIRSSNPAADEASAHVAGYKVKLLKADIESSIANAKKVVGDMLSHDKITSILSKTGKALDPAMSLAEHLRMFSIIRNEKNQARKKYNIPKSKVSRFIYFIRRITTNMAGRTYAVHLNKDNLVKVFGVDAELAEAIMSLWGGGDSYIIMRPVGKRLVVNIFNMITSYSVEESEHLLKKLIKSKKWNAIASSIGVDFTNSEQDLATLRSALLYAALRNAKQINHMELGDGSFDISFGSIVNYDTSTNYIAEAHPTSAYQFFVRAAQRLSRMRSALPDVLVQFADNLTDDASVIFKKDFLAEFFMSMDSFLSAENVDNDFVKDNIESLSSTLYALYTDMGESSQMTALLGKARRLVINIMSYINSKTANPENDEAFSMLSQLLLQLDSFDGDIFANPEQDISKLSYMMTPALQTTNPVLAFFNRANARINTVRAQLFKEVSDDIREVVSKYKEKMSGKGIQGEGDKYERLFKYEERVVNGEKVKINTYKLIWKTDPEWSSLSKEEQDFIIKTNELLEQEVRRSVMSKFLHEGFSSEEAEGMVEAWMKSNYVPGLLPVYDSKLIEALYNNLLYNRERISQAFSGFSYNERVKVGENSFHLKNMLLAQYDGSSKYGSIYRQKMLGLLGNDVDLERNKSLTKDIGKILLTSAFFSVKYSLYKELEVIYRAARALLIARERMTGYQLGNILTQLDDIAQAVIYGRRLKTSPTSTERAVGKLVQVVNNVSTVMLLGMSVKTATANLLSGVQAILRDTLIKNKGTDRFQDADVRFAVNELTNNFDKVMAVLRASGIYQADDIDLLTKRFWGNNKDKFTVNDLFIMDEFGDRMLRGVLTVAQMRRDGLYDGFVYDKETGKLSYDESKLFNDKPKDERELLIKHIKDKQKIEGVGDGKTLQHPFYSTISARLQGIVNETLGSFSDVDKAAVSTNAIFASVMKLRTYLFTMYARAVSPEKYNPSIKKLVVKEGEVMELNSFEVGIITSLKKALVYAFTKDEWGNSPLTDEDKRNINITLYTLILFASMYFIGAFAMGDDDDDPRTKNLAQRLYMNMMDDILSIMFVGNVHGILSNPLITYSFITRVARGLWGLISLDWRKTGNSLVSSVGFINSLDALVATFYPLKPTIGESMAVWSDNIREMLGLQRLEDKIKEKQRESAIRGRIRAKLRALYEEGEITLEEYQYYYEAELEKYGLSRKNWIE
jgi:hypothetical protein